MNKLLLFVVFILKTLIKIGDFVILTHEKTKSFFKGTKNFFLNSKKRLKTGTKQIYKKKVLKTAVRIDIFLNQARFFYLEKKINLKKEYKRLKRKVLRKIKKIQNEIALSIQLILEKIGLGFQKIKRFLISSEFFFRSSFSSSFHFLNLPFLTRAKKRGRKPKKKIFPLFFKLKYTFLGVFISTIVVFLPILFLIFLESLPNPNELSLREVAQTTKIYDRNGILLYQIYANQNRTLVPLNSIPKDLIDATISIEDKEFYSNPGFDILAIIRAAIANFKGEPLQGGSTITQQLIKSSLLTPERTIKRKVKEIILAFYAEQIYSKDKILEMYFNQVPYGGTAWGVEAAAQTYFGKSVKDLTLAQSAVLAGMPRAPSIYSPYGEYPELWRKRQIDVLRRMEELRYITKAEKEKAEKEKITFQPPRTPIHAPHFVMYVRDYLVNKYGLNVVEKGGLKVVTSLDLKTQEMAERTVAEEVAKSAKYNLTNGAALITNPKNGDILAMVGSKDYEEEKDGKVNLTTSKRQPGSTVKAVTYSAALLKGMTAATVISDSPISYNSGGSVYSPVNYDRKYHGNVTIRKALGNSINIPAVKVLAQIGVDEMVELARKMGIKDWDNSKDYGLSITLGAAETRMTDLATVYGTLANNGQRVDLNPVLKITDFKGAIIDEKSEQGSGKRVIPQEVAFIISDILADNNARSMAFGTNSPLNIKGQRVSVKTGTTDNLRDNWAIGFTPSLLTAVWVGNNNNEPMSGIASGITGATPIWNKIMTTKLKELPREKVSIPEGIVPKICYGYVEYFIKGNDNTRCPSATKSSSLVNR